jgi:hypothetical protein
MGLTALSSTILLLKLMPDFSGVIWVNSWWFVLLLQATKQMKEKNRQ